MKSLTQSGAWCGCWTVNLNGFVSLACGVALLFAARDGLKGLNSSMLLEFPNIPALGGGKYGMSMLGTIGELIAREELRGKSMAVWGGSMAKAHDLPFRWRVTADWFLLPAKGVPIVASAEEAFSYEYILSPWQLGNQLVSEGRKVEMVAEENRVWLYRISTEEGKGE